jgi:hypothetical protein
MVREILEKFRQMTPENKLNFLSNARVALAAQENTRKAMNPAPEKAGCGERA